jgi:hypothetical protein
MFRFFEERDSNERAESSERRLVELTAAEIAEVQGEYFLLYWLLCTPAH